MEWKIKLLRKNPKIKKSKDRQQKTRMRDSDNKVINMTVEGIQERRKTLVEALMSTFVM